MKAADVLLTLPFHHLYLDALAVLVLAALFWRFNLSHWAMESNRARAMRWRTRCHLRPGAGFATWPSWFTSGAAWPPPSEAAGPAPA